jgi:hypothetical protein
MCILFVGKESGLTQPHSGYVSVLVVAAGRF